MGVTVNHWLVEFDSLMRSQVVNELDALMVGQRAVTPWLRQVGSIPTRLTKLCKSIKQLGYSVMATHRILIPLF